MLVTFNISNIVINKTVNETAVAAVIEKNDPPRFDLTNFDLEYLVVPNKTAALENGEAALVSQLTII